METHLEQGLIAMAATELVLAGHQQQLRLECCVLASTVWIFTLERLPLQFQLFVVLEMLVHDVETVLHHVHKVLVVDIPVASRER